jgi:hypothetical protein
MREINNTEKTFGIVFAIFFLIVGLFSIFNEGKLLFIWFFISLIFLLLGIFFPKTLKQLNIIWLKFGLILHSVTSPVILGVMFFLVITPIGLIMRFLGRRPLSLKNSNSLNSYWKKCKPPFDKNSFRDQF